MSYKKRGQAGYTGKKEAKSKVSRERNYAKKEIRQELKELEEGDTFRYKAGGRNRNRIAHLKYWIGLYDKRAEAAQENNQHGIFGYSWYGSGITKMKEELEELEKSHDKNHQRNLRMLDRLSKIKIKIENMQSCHIVSYPISNTRIDGKLVFEVTDEGFINGIDAASDFSGAFHDVKAGLIREIYSWIDGMEEDDDELAKVAEDAREAHELMNKLLDRG